MEPTLCCELGIGAELVADGWIEAEHAEFGRACVAGARVCLRCGALRNHDGWRASRAALFALRGRRAIGRHGSWKKLLLPRFDEIGVTVGSADLIVRTIKRRRFEAPFHAMDRSTIEGLVRRELGLPPNNWPRGIPVMAWSCPLVLHAGLAYTFSGEKRDRPHLFLMSYTADALRFPTEVWLGTHRGRRRVRFLKKLSTANGTHTLLACADPHASVVVSSYVIAPHICDASREGTLLYASWAA